MKNIPNLFLIGAPKAGTTALATNLSLHNEIYLPNQKEPRYFDANIYYDDSKDYITKTFNEYLSFYNSDEASFVKYRMDASVFNMYSKESIENILKVSPNAKFILILRDPVKASLSMFNQRLKYSDIKMREVSEDFNYCWKLLERREKGEGYPKGCKNKFLFRYDMLYSYQNYVPYLIEKLDNNLFIGFYEDYVEDPEIFYNKIFNFLGLKHIGIENKKVNESYIVKPSLVLNILDLVLKKTYKVRYKLGLVGLNILQNKFFDKYKVTPIKNCKIDDVVYEYFKPTYDYIDRLKSEIGNSF